MFVDECPCSHFSADQLLVSWRVIGCGGKCWMHHLWNQAGLVKDACLSYGSLPWSPIYRTGGRYGVGGRYMIRPDHSPCPVQINHPLFPVTPQEGDLIMDLTWSSHPSIDDQVIPLQGRGWLDHWRGGGMCSTQVREKKTKKREKHMAIFKVVIGQANLAWTGRLKRTKAWRCNFPIIATSRSHNKK